MNVKEAKRAGLLHDIGKAVDHKIKARMPAIAPITQSDSASRQDCFQAIARTMTMSNQYALGALLIQAADSLSAARPGARRRCWKPM